MPSHIASFAVTFAAGVLGSFSLAGEIFVITDVTGDLSGRGSGAIAINDLGEVVGPSDISGKIGGVGVPAEPFVSHAYLFDGIGTLDLGCLAGGGDLCQSVATDVNSFSRVCGWAAEPTQHAFIWSAASEPSLGLSGGITLLPALLDGNHVPFAMSDTHVVVGRANNAAGSVRRPVRWTFDGLSWRVEDLGTLFPDNTGTGEALGVNNKGEAVGSTQQPGGSLGAFINLPQAAYGLSAGLHPIAPNDVISTRASDINNKGEVVGDALGTPFIWLPEPAYGLPAGHNVLPRITDPNNPFGETQPVLPTAINESGQIVGRTTVFVDGNDIPQPRGAYWDGGSWFVVEQLIPPGSGWRLLGGFALDINNAGQISAVAVSETETDILGRPLVRGVVLSPTINPCPADVNLDGVLDITDRRLFLDLFRAGDPRAEFSGDNVVNGQDARAYAAAFVAGCP